MGWVELLWVCAMHQWIPAAAQGKWKEPHVRRLLVIANLARATFYKINMRERRMQNWAVILWRLYFWIYICSVNPWKLAMLQKLEARVSVACDEETKRSWKDFRKVEDVCNRTFKKLSEGHLRDLYPNTMGKEGRRETLCEWEFEGWNAVVTPGNCTGIWVLAHLWHNYSDKCHAEQY